MRRLSVVMFLFLLTGSSVAQAPASSASAPTPIDVQPVKELKPTGSLGTCSYALSEKEKPFFGKLDRSEQVTGSFMEPYSIHGKQGKSVSWFGIVRGISRQLPEDNTYTLLLEHKYFDGLSDCHIMLVSKKGSGDFLATVRRGTEPIPALSLVRIYGVVTEEKNKLPNVSVEYLRVWPWFTFTLTDLGAEDHSNPRWAKYCRICKGSRIYNPYPTEDYYVGMLGDPKDFGLQLRDFNANGQSTRP